MFDEMEKYSENIKSKNMLKTNYGAGGFDFNGD